MNQAVFSLCELKLVEMKQFFLGLFHLFLFLVSLPPQLLVCVSNGGG